MKKLLFVILFFSLTVVSTAQFKFNVGVNFSGNSTWLMNPAYDLVIFPETVNQDIKMKPSWGISYGLMFGYSFLDVLGASVELNYNNVNQKYSEYDIGIISYNHNIIGTVSASNTIKYKTFDIPLLLRFGNIVYVEAGPLFQFVNKAIIVGEYEYDIMDDANNFERPEREERDVKDDYKKFGMGAALGFGVNIGLIPNILKLNVGLRFNYVFSDMHGVNVFGTSKDDLESFSPGGIEKFKTHPLYGGLKIGLIYKF